MLESICSWVFAVIDQRCLVQGTAALPSLCTNAECAELEPELVEKNLSSVPPWVNPAVVLNCKLCVGALVSLSGTQLDKWLPKNAFISLLGRM